MRLRSLARLFPVLLFALGTALVPHASKGQGTSFSPALPLTHIDNGPNSDWAQRQHYVILVSLDGFRWDYAKRDNATHLLALGRRGVSAPDGMIPSYPSLTFPNHFTIVTGLYPEHHGIVANSFLDPATGARYSYSDSKVTSEGSWYSGVPLWSLAESKGMRTVLSPLGRLRSQNRRLPTHLVRALRQQRVNVRVATGAHRRHRRPASPSCRRSSPLHRHLFFRARPLGPRVRPRRARNSRGRPQNGRNCRQA